MPTYKNTYFGIKLEDPSITLDLHILKDLYTKNYAFWRLFIYVL